VPIILLDEEVKLCENISDNEPGTPHSPCKKKKSKIFEYCNKMSSSKKRKKRIKKSSSKGLIVGGGSMPLENV